MVCMAQGDLEDRKKLRRADKEKLREMEAEADVDQRLTLADDLAEMGLRCGGGC